MRGGAQQPAGWLNLQIKNRDARQAGAERTPIRPAITREVNADVGARIQVVRIERIDRERIDWN